jgi:mono/diheme cytochrome c family protein
MLGNIIAVALLVAAIVAIGFGIRAAWRTRKALVRWPVAILGSLVAAICLLVTGAALRGFPIAYAKGGRPAPQLTVERTPERIARGKYIVGNWCVTCHSPNGELPARGGKDLATEIPFPIGSLVTGNLTPGGRIKDWTDGEIFRAIREGYDPQGNKLLVMQAQYARYLSDDDLKSVIAYLRSQEPVGTTTTVDRLNFLGLAMGGAGMFPSIKEPPPETIPSVPEGATVEYGKYMVSWMNCRECHGPNFAGQKGGILPTTPSLRVAQTWTTEQFLQTMRTGTTPYGRKLDSLMMPWKNIGRFSDTELQAIHAYLKSVEIPLPAK